MQQKKGQKCMIKKLIQEQEQQLVDWRKEWLAIGSSVERADRATAEGAIVEMYRLLGRQAPRFVWVDSPATSALLRHVLESDSLEESLWEPLGTKLINSLGASLRFRSSLGHSLANSLGDSLRFSLRESIETSLRESIETSLRASLRSSLEDSLERLLWVSLKSSLESSLEVSLDDSLANSLGDSLRLSFRGSLKISLKESLEDSLESSLRGSLEDLLGESLETSLEDSLRISLESSLRGSLEDLSSLDTTSWFWGSGESYWVAFYLFCNEIGVPYKDEDKHKLSLWADLCRSCF